MIARHTLQHTPQGIAMQDLADMLRSSNWGRLLTQQELDRVLHATHEQSLSAREVAGRMGEPPTHWVGVISGLLKISVTNAEGRASTLTAIGAGGWFGEGTLLKREPRRYDVIAVKASRLALMPIGTFEWLRQNSLPFNHQLQTLMNARLGQFIGQLECGRLLDTNARVARCLADLFNADLYPERSPFVELHQGEVGLLSGFSRQRANRALHALQNDGLLRVEKRGVTIVELDALRRVAGLA
jgi:CRP/FNR family transcriptional regulator, cyclic AMP receptor protein